MTDVVFTVIIADDHAIVRAGVRALLTPQAAFSVIGEASSFEEIKQLIHVQVPDILMLDLHGLREPPITMVAGLRKTIPECQLLIFSSSIELAPELLRLGVAGYVVKEELSSHVIAALHALVKEEQYISPVVIDHLTLAANTWKTHGLTATEAHVLALLAQGLGTTQIAETLRIDPRTVQNSITVKADFLLVLAAFW